MKTAIRKTTLAILMVLGLCFVLSSATAQNAGAEGQNFEELLQIIDSRSNFQGDISATFSMEIIDPEKGNDIRQVRFFRRDDEDKFLLLIQKPETQLGQGYLNIEDGLWFYDPESRQFTFTSLSERFAGSDANNEDFRTSSLADNYDVASAAAGTLGNFDVWILDLTATNDEVTYPFKKVWITKDGSLLLKSEDYSLTRRLLRTVFYPSYAKIGDNLIADKTIFVDALVKNKRTTISITDISTAPIPDDVFTKAYVERVNR